MFEDVSVVDVYDLASEIGAECEKLIDIFGPNSVKTLIPKCISALEMLEFLANKNENESSMVQELKDRITRLEEEKLAGNLRKKNFEKVNTYILLYTHRDYLHSPDVKLNFYQCS